MSPPPRSSNQLRSQNRDCSSNLGGSSGPVCPLTATPETSSKWEKGFEAFPGIFPLSFLTWILTWQRWTSKGKRENSMLQVIVGFANNDISTNTAPSSFNEQFTAIWWMMWGPCRPCWGELGCWGRPSTPPFSSCGGRRWVSRSCPIAWSSRPQNTDCKTMSIDY